MRCRAALVLAVVLGGISTGVQAGPVRLPGGAELREVSFERHVASLLGKFGCSSGSCHGSFKGKGGLRLSLFAYDPEMDFHALTRDALGRRVDVARPDQSLLLLKATGQVEHGGGKRFDRDSWTYRVIRAWIAGDCRRSAGSGVVRVLRVVPEVHSFQRPGEVIQLKVMAEFVGGAQADVTPFCGFRVKDDLVAEVSLLGEVRGVGPGDTPVVVSYRGNLTTARVLVPAPMDKGVVYPEVHPDNYIDREVLAKLRRLNMVPSGLADDAEFLRRVHIDTIGDLPAPEEVRAFLADSRPDKRARKIEELLAHPLHAALWATRFCDITVCNVDVMDGPAELRGRRATMWHDWFRRRFAANVPYDQVVRGVLCATSRDGQDVRRWIGREAALERAARQGFDSTYAQRQGLDLFWRRLSGDDYFPTEQMAELTAAAFLGVRLECAQCHKHPFDTWTQADYRAFANVFAEVQFGSSPEVTEALVDLLAERRRLPAGKAGPPIPRLREVYVSSHRPRRLPHPETNAFLPARAPGGPELEGPGDPRVRLFEWLVRPDNPYFAPNLVNRVWAHYLGTGLVEPVDSFSLANPPSNGPLLGALARDFVDHGYDVRHLERTILNSRTYQQSSRPNRGNMRDRTNFAHARARPLLAEAAVDVLNSALGTAEDLGPDALPGRHAIEVAPNRVQSPYLARAFRVFGRPARTSLCDCERAVEPAVPQTLFLMADPVVLQKIGSGRLRRLLASGRPDGEVVEELFLATLSRFPGADEKRAALEHVQGARDRRAGFVDVVWALINTREFILNH